MPIRLPQRRCGLWKRAMKNSRSNSSLPAHGWGAFKQKLKTKTCQFICFLTHVDIWCCTYSSGLAFTPTHKSDSNLLHDLHPIRASRHPCRRRKMSAAYRTCCTRATNSGAHPPTPSSTHAYKNPMFESKYSPRQENAELKRKLRAAQVFAENH